LSRNKIEWAADETGGNVVFYYVPPALDLIECIAGCTDTKPMNAQILIWVKRTEFVGSDRCFVLFQDEDESEWLEFPDSKFPSEEVQHRLRLDAKFKEIQQPVFHPSI